MASIDGESVYKKKRKKDLNTGNSIMYAHMALSIDSFV